MCRAGIVSSDPTTMGNSSEASSLRISLLFLIFYYILLR